MEDQAHPVSDLGCGFGVILDRVELESVLGVGVDDGEAVVSLGHPLEHDENALTLHQQR